ncbi:hypothetical protein MLD38_010859 [Melastoma candidum]|uniref:Uncharacterized protein n=1 Tax=Melastoma candidum TaxID=119954 RepID=A0ACB9R308_9MYRT|nr:hypothetical protein MLD38_010859 [Melastoma candidum]
MLLQPQRHPTLYGPDFKAVSATVSSDARFSLPKFEFPSSIGDYILQLKLQQAVFPKHVPASSMRSSNGQLQQQHIPTSALRRSHSLFDSSSGHPEARYPR